jgi:CMP-2-keto-3-deoxyoctulosonic acid synthetase
VEKRIALVKRILEVYNSRYEDFAQAMSTEMGAPIEWARGAQAWAGQVHIEATIKAAEEMSWEYSRGTTRIVYEGIGVCALITPWNWPMNQIACKVAPALIAGCTMVLKPSEIAPLSGVLFAQVCHDAGLPPGVFNLVNGTGPEVGARMSSHPDVDMVSFTGSTRAGTAVAAAAAPTVKRVAQELGGKSPNIILAAADLEAAASVGVDWIALSFVQRADDVADAMLRMIRGAFEALVIGDPENLATDVGPVIDADAKRALDDHIAAMRAKGRPVWQRDLPPECRNGTERCAQALSALPDVDIVVNLQGDAPLTPAHLIPDLVAALAARPGAAMATAALRATASTYQHLVRDAAQGRVGGTCAVVAGDGRALYFSKRIIPFIPEAEAAPHEALHLHLGLYAYRPEALRWYAAQPPSPLETLEGLEQLRFLEGSAPVQVVTHDPVGWDCIELNNPEDAPVIEAILAARGID